MVALAEQYLAFIAEVNCAWSWRRLSGDGGLARVPEIAAVAAARGDAGPAESAEELAHTLAFRLLRLEAMRAAAAKLMTRKRLGVHVFARGMPEDIRTIRERQYTA